MTLPSNQNKAKDRRWFKTPFFKIEVSEPQGEYIELPMQVTKLLSQIEISEFLNGCNKNQIKLSFVEGSREPYNTDSETAATSYTGGSFTNSSGFIPDLKVLTSGGSFVSFASLASDQIASAIDLGNDALDAVGLGGLFSVEEVKSSDRKNVNNNSAVYLFSPRNRVRVTWGYVEDPETQRIFSGSITIVRTNFPETGMPTTDIIAHGPMAYAEQYTPVQGTRFGSAGSLLEDFTDTSIADVLDYIADNSDFDVIRSDSFEGDIVDEDKTKVWVAGETLNQFLNRIAREVDAHYTMVDNPITGKPTIVFLQKDEMDNSTIVPSDLMTYKGPGSILKSVNITADYATPSGDAKVGINRQGEFVETKSNGQEGQTLFKGNVMADTDSLNGPNAHSAATSTESLSSNRNTSAYTEYTPAVNLLNTAQKRATSAALCRAENTVTLEFSTIGYTNITPGSCPFKGLGRRYSGVYSIEQVSHVIDSTGYTCKGMAKGVSHGGEGIEPVEGTKEELTPTSEKKQLFQSLTRVKAGSSGSSSGQTSLINRVTGLI